MMYRIAAFALPVVLAAGVASADPVQLTDAQMDTVTAGFAVNGNELFTFEEDNGDVTLTVVAGEGDDVVIPDAVHDTVLENRPITPDVGFVGTGMWSAGFATEGLGTPIEHF